MGYYPRGEMDIINLETNIQNRMSGKIREKAIDKRFFIYRLTKQYISSKWP